MNITHWNGRHGKGAMRARREQKRAEAKSRQEGFGKVVAAIQEAEGGCDRERAIRILEAQRAYARGDNPAGEELLREVFTK